MTKQDIINTILNRIEKNCPNLIPDHQGNRVHSCKLQEIKPAHKFNNEEPHYAVCVLCYPNGLFDSSKLQRDLSFMCYSVFAKDLFNEWYHPKKVNWAQINSLELMNEYFNEFKHVWMPDYIIWKATHE